MTGLVMAAGAGGLPLMGIVGLCSEGDMGCMLGLNPCWNPAMAALKGM